MTPGQANVVAYFADLPELTKVRTSQATYDTCRARGWIERTEQFPYHRTTKAGLAALAEHMRQTAKK